MSLDGHRVVLVEPDPADDGKWLPVRDIALVTNADMGLVIASQVLSNHGAPAVCATNVYQSKDDAQGVLVTGAPVNFAIFIDGVSLTDQDELYADEMIVPTVPSISE